MAVKLQFIEQELIVIKTEQKKYGHLFKNHKNLAEKVLHCQSWMRENTTQTRDQDTEDLRDTNDVTIDQMELRITNLESQSHEGAQQCLHERALKSEQDYAAECVTESLRTELNEQDEQSPRT
ncbi:ankyrin repeat domain-containing protein 26-like [Sigmodon hispidus]